VGDPGDKAATVVVVVAEGGRELRMSVDEGRCDLAFVDVLMRMALEAHRGRYRVRIEGAPPELRGLLELVGLADVVALEPRREPELGEHLGVEEVVQPGDAPA
jgi:hypothetical protein